MKKLLLLIGVAILTIPSPFAGKINSSGKKNKQIAEKNLNARPSDPKQAILWVSDSICASLDVPAKLIREIGQNESGWRCIKSLSGGTDYGDLQVVESTFNFWYDQLELEGGKTRENYLIVGIHYLKYLHDRYGSWKKARFAYARGHWRGRDTWTCLEIKFMDKIDWSKYDV
ncbi:MAG: transglycosylase SLT domain-containing protein [Flavobacteriales bacterium]|nr:transglycosylase SLT domain-containing protein [Bacteroidota bacterium]MCB9239885.1 transglycosylase SLT domain-containing protein [Flavobacteriales bacterium]